MARAPVLTISEQEIMDAIAIEMAKSSAPDEAQTAKEISEATGRTMHAVNVALNALAKQKRLGVFRVRRMARDLVTRTVVAYTILPKK